MAVVFPSQGVATPSEIPRREIIELLNELLFCHLPDSECSVVNLGAEIHQCISNLPRAATLTVACVEVHSGAKQGLNSAPLTSSGS